MERWVESEALQIIAELAFASRFRPLSGPRSTGTYIKFSSRM